MRRIGIVVAGLVAVTSLPLAAQRAALREVRDRGSAGLSLVVGQPWGDFKRNGDVAAGVNVFGVTGRTLGVRIEGAYFGYDAEYQGYGVSTTSSIGSLAAGPQLTIGQGALRLYAFATLGGSLFWSAVSHDGCGCYDDDVFFLEGDFTTNRSTGTGLLLTVSSRRTPIMVDLGVREVRHDRVSYVPADGLSQNPDGTYSAQRVETPVGMRVWHLGVTIGIR
ncbi:MAG: hypothetical protein ACREME_01475 [Gemmatimonadales bacterium]